MQRLLLLPLLFAGVCMAHARGVGVRAVPDALPCALQTLAGAGYRILQAAEQGATGSFTAEGEMPGTAPQRGMGEVAVAVWGKDGDERRIRVGGRRHEEIVAQHDRSARPAPRRLSR